MSEVFGVRTPNTLVGNETCVPASLTLSHRLLVRVQWQGSRSPPHESSTLQFIQRLDNFFGIQPPALVIFLAGDADGSILINCQVCLALFPDILLFAQQFIAAHTNRFLDRQNDPSYVPINLIGKTDHFSNAARLCSGARWIFWTIQISNIICLKSTVKTKHSHEISCGCLRSANLVEKLSRLKVLRKQGFQQSQNSPGSPIR
jgi:hypothetical protein